MTHEYICKEHGSLGKSYEDCFAVGVDLKPLIRLPPNVFQVMNSSFCLRCYLDFLIANIGDLTVKKCSD